MRSVERSEEFNSESWEFYELAPNSLTIVRAVQRSEKIGNEFRKWISNIKIIPELI
jgi:hypothetical protein